jgi:hypothetical protein
MSTVGLFTSQVLDAHIGVYRPRPVVDGATGVQVGTAQHLTVFMLFDEADCEVLRVVREPTLWGMPRRWFVFDVDANEIGMIVAGSWRNPLEHPLPRRNADPWEWYGSVVIDATEVATISGGAITDAATRAKVADLTRVQTAARPHKRVNARWRLTLADEIDDTLRAMALGWLGAAFEIEGADEDD